MGEKIEYLNAPGDELNWKPYEIKDFGSFGKSFFTFISTYLIGFNVSSMCLWYV